MNANEIRVHCQAVADHDARVEEVFRAAFQSSSARNVRSIRCTSHRNGKAPILAKYWFEPHILAVSRIDVLLSDQLTLRPWERRVLLRELPGTSTSDDDVLLVDYVQHLDQWSRGLQSTGETWLKPPGEFFIHDVLIIATGRPVRPEFWTRCKDHPEASSNWAVDKLRNL